MAIQGDRRVSVGWRELEAQQIGSGTMTQDWSVPGWAVLAAGGVLLLLIVGMGLVVLSARRRVEAHLARTQQTAESLAEQVAELEARFGGGGAAGAGSTSSDEQAEDDRADYVITRIGDLRDDGAVNHDDAAFPALPRAVFADLLLRETAVRAIGLTAGLRRAFAAETRNRIRFEMKQEVKRSRKQRKTDLRIARREWETKQRTTGSMTHDVRAEPTA